MNACACDQPGLRPVEEAIADLLADSDVGASKGGLFDEQRQLSALIGRPTTSLAALMQVALK